MNCNVARSRTLQGGLFLTTAGRTLVRKSKARGGQREPAPRGPGSASPPSHIGVALRVVVSTSEDARTYVNNEIEWASPETILHREGSVSMPGLHDEVQRHARIRISYEDAETTADGRVRRPARPLPLASDRSAQTTCSSFRSLDLARKPGVDHRERRRRAPMRDEVVSIGRDTQDVEPLTLCHGEIVVAAEIVLQTRIRCEAEGPNAIAVAGPNIVLLDIADVERHGHRQRSALRLQWRDTGARLKSFRHRVVGVSVTIIAGQTSL